MRKFGCYIRTKPLPNEGGQENQFWVVIEAEDYFDAERKLAAMYGKDAIWGLMSE